MKFETNSKKSGKKKEENERDLTKRQIKIRMKENVREGCTLAFTGVSHRQKEQILDKFLQGTNERGCDPGSPFL